jgi:hypothetical protein
MNRDDRSAPRWRTAAPVLVAALAAQGAVHAMGRLDARNGDECRAQVNANFDARAAEMRAHGNARGLAANEARGRQPALEECAQMDQRVRNEAMVDAYSRLSAAIETLRAGGDIPPAQQRALAADHDAMEKLPAAPYRTAYLRSHADYLRYLAVAPASTAASHAARAAPAAIRRCTSATGEVEFRQGACAAGSTGSDIALRRDDAPAVDGETCAVLASRIAASRRAQDDAVAALIAGASAPANDWRDAESRRVAALSDLQFNEARASARGCR